MSSKMVLGFVIGVTASAVSAGVLYNCKSSDTSKNSLLTGKSEEPNLNVLNTIRCTSSQHVKKFDLALQKSRALVKRFKDEVGTPGLVIGVSVDGDVVWEEGFGYSDLENGIPCHTKTVMRIASISKPISMTLLAKLWENKKVDLDKPVQEYVKYFPFKKFDGKNVTLTVRQLASHTGGIRHYKKKNDPATTDADHMPEFYIKEKFENLKKSVAMFQDDELLFRPGSSFGYTTHGYTLLSAVIEEAGKKPFTEQIKELFDLIGLKHTCLDEVQKIIYNRANYYTKNKHGKLVNAQLADTSYKWAGGGMVSTVGDLLKFGNAMLYFYQQSPADKPGYLNASTVKELWTPAEHSSMKWGRESRYGLGWTIVPELDDVGGAEKQRFYVGHGGGAVGASSILIIVPNKVLDENNNVTTKNIPSGVSVAVLTNLEDLSCRQLARDVAELFYEVQYNAK